MVAAAAALALGVLASPAPAAARPVASYEMNESAGTHQLHDSGPRGIDGRIGDDVILGATYRGARGHRFPNVAPAKPPVRPGHIDRVPNRAALNPGRARFVLVVRYRTTKPFGNIVQKGQSGVAGGYFKLEAPHGKPRCLFRGGNGAQRSGFVRRDLSDGQWHTVRCVRTASSVEMYVDGRRTSRRVGPTGRISNSWGMTIGGKSKCNQRKVSCDYFVGTIDFVRLRKGS